MSADSLDADADAKGDRGAVRTRACRLTSTAIATAVVPYQEPAPKGDTPEFQSTLSSTMPMAAVFMRNKYVGW